MNRMIVSELLLGLAAGGAERQREATEWSITYAYETHETALPRVLLIGDSICNSYQIGVRDALKGTATTSFWATSKCVTDRSYLKELAFILDEYPYAVIHVNNGLHSLNTDRAAWSAALREVLSLLQARGGGARLIWATSTPLRDPALTAKARELNAIAAEVVRDAGLPTNDLFALMDPQDRALWRDTFHFGDAGRQMLAERVVEAVRAALPTTAAKPAPEPAEP